MENPFTYGQSIRENADFCPRSGLEKRLRGCFSSGKNVVVRGERRVGKTSLIHRAARNTRGKRVVYIDLQGVKSVADVLKRAIHGVESLEKAERMMPRLLEAFSNLSLTIATNPVTGFPTFSPTFSASEPSPGHLNRLVDLWEKLNAQRKIIVVLDEFQDILAVPEAETILDILRDRIEKLPAIPFCFVGSVRYEMDRLFSSPGAPFHQSATALTIAPDDFDAFLKFLTAKFKSGNRKVDTVTLDLILDLAGHLPGDVQQLCAAIWDRTERNRRIDEDAVRHGLEGIFRNELKGYEHLVLSSSAQQLAVLRTLARLGGRSIQAKSFIQDTGITHASSVKAAMMRLIDRRIVFHNGAEYRFANTFFKAWLLQSGI